MSERLHARRKLRVAFSFRGKRKNDHLDLDSVLEMAFFDRTNPRSDGVPILMRKFAEAVAEEMTFSRSDCDGTFHVGHLYVASPEFNVIVATMPTVITYT